MPTVAVFLLVDRLKTVGDSRSDLCCYCGAEKWVFLSLTAAFLFPQHGDSVRKTQQQEKGTEVGNKSSPSLNSSLEGSNI